MKDFLAGQGRELALIISYLALFVFTLWLFDVKRKIERLVTFLRDHPQVVHVGLAVIILGPIVIWLAYTVWWQGVKIFFMIVQKVWRVLT